MPIPGPARIEPLPDDQLPEWMDNNKDIPKVNVVKTLARHPDLLRPWNRFAAHVIGDTSTLSPRQREIAILRTGWNHQSDYEFGQHRIIGRRAGLSEEEILNIARGPDTGTWSAAERLLLVVADELFANSEVSDETWDALGEHYADLQKVDIIFAVGQYTLVCFALKSLRVQLDEGVDGLPEI
ncbi:MAG: carboxymuconolactone decarboxylase family protein [Alphaproteobacteria bacterium]